MIIAKSNITGIGEIIHFIAGQETELATALTGTVTIPLTALEEEFGLNDSTVLMFTRCQREYDIAKTLAANKGHFIMCGTTNFVGKAEKDKPQELDPRDRNKLYNKGVCGYCKQETDLVPIPGFQICPVCAQIELGRVKDGKGVEE